jgi:hypothetical protein
VSGNLDVTLADDTTVLLIRTSGDTTLRSMTAGTGAGREVMIEHDRLSGTGNLTIEHNSAGGTFFKFFNPGTQAFVLGQTENCLVRDRSGFWRSQTLARPVRPDWLCVVENNRAIAWEERVAFSATGVTGTMVDVTVWNADAPFALRILRAKLRVSTAAGTACALRTAAAGAGSVVLPDAGAATQTFDTSATGHFDDNAAATATVAASGSVFFNVDRAVAGELILTCVRT